MNAGRLYLLFDIRVSLMLFFYYFSNALLEKLIQNKGDKYNEHEE